MRSRRQKKKRKKSDSRRKWGGEKKRGSGTQKVERGMRVGKEEPALRKRVCGCLGKPLSPVTLCPSALDPICQRNLTLMMSQ